jgi:hypothetical protein
VPLHHGSGGTTGSTGAGAGGDGDVRSSSLDDLAYGFDEDIEYELYLQKAAVGLCRLESS